jgi:MFS family permease
MKAFSQVKSTFHSVSQSGLGVCFLCGFLFWSSMAAQLPTMPLYLRSLNAPPDHVGWVMGAFAIGLLFSRTYLGRLSDRSGRCLVMQIGLVVATIMPMFYAVTESIPLLFGLRAIHGISIAAFATGYSALTSDLAPQEQRGSVIGYMSLVNPLGMAIGPILGDWTQYQFGYSVMFRLAGFLALVGLAISFWINESVPDNDVQLQEDRITRWQIKSTINSQAEQLNLNPDFWKEFLNVRVWVPAFTLFMVGLSFGTLSSFLPLLIKETGVDMSVGLFYLVTAIAGFSIRIFVSRYSDRVGRGLFINIGLFFYGLSMLLIFFAHTKLEFFCAAFSEGIGAGLVIPSIVTMLADRTLPRERGFILGLVLMGFDLGIACAGPVAGNIIKLTSLSTAFLVATAQIGLAVLVFSTQANFGLSSSLRFAIGRGRDKCAIADN